MQECSQCKIVCGDGADRCPSCRAWLRDTPPPYKKPSKPGANWLLLLLTLPVYWWISKQYMPGLHQKFFGADGMFHFVDSIIRRLISGWGAE